MYWACTLLVAELLERCPLSDHIVKDVDAGWHVGVRGAAIRASTPDIVFLHGGWRNKKRKKE